MLKVKQGFISLLVLIAIALFSNSVLAADLNITTKAYLANDGWLNAVPAGEVAGKTGEAKALEAIIIDSNKDSSEIGIAVTSHISNIGWTDQVVNGQVGNMSDPIEALQISLIGEEASEYDIYYRAHSANFGWLDWAKNGEIAGTTGCNFPMEAIEIVTVPAGSKAPGSTINPSVDKNQISLSITTHVRNLGWLDSTNDGMAGTTGQSAPIEAVEVVINDPTGKSGVVGEAHVAEIGWQGESTANTVIGTTGQALSIEAARFYLTGPAAEIYDISYRAHVANMGWLGWTSNGQIAGSSNAATAVEALQINLVKKGTATQEENSYRFIDTPAGIIPSAPTCIVISIPQQRMVYYENYNVVIDTNVVTGMDWIDPTRTGDMTVLEKLSPYRTKGPGYDAIVDYWLTLYRGEIYGFDGAGPIVDRVGIHDASWRTNWRSNAYLTDGSHGCVNTPYSPMKYIFEHAQVGTPVRIR